MERQLVEKECDTCHKKHLFAPEALNPEIINEMETWILVGTVKYDGHGNFLPQMTHHCGKACLAKHYGQSMGVQ